MKLGLVMDTNMSLSMIMVIYINPFHATKLFWYPLKTSENQRFSDVFRGYQKRSVAWNGLSNLYKICQAHENKLWNERYLVSILVKILWICFGNIFRKKRYALLVFTKMFLPLLWNLKKNKDCLPNRQHFTRRTHETGSKINPH